MTDALIRVDYAAGMIYCIRLSMILAMRKTAIGSVKKMQERKITVTSIRMDQWSVMHVLTRVIIARNMSALLPPRAR